MILYSKSALVIPVEPSSKESVDLCFQDCVICKLLHALLNKLSSNLNLNCLSLIIIIIIIIIIISSSSSSSSIEMV